MKHFFLLIAVLTASGSVYGQADPTITTQPGFPTAGMDLFIEITFQDETVTEASIAVRPLGSPNSYTTFDATLTSNVETSVFEVTVPGDQMVSQGLETFVTYMLDGQQFTYPPGGSPLRTPTFTLRLRPDVLLTPREYRMIGIPFQFLADQGESFGSGTLDQVLGDDFGPYNPARWRVLRWNPLTEAYLEGSAAVPKVNPGEGFWLITSSGGDFDVEGGVTPGFVQQGSNISIGPVSVTLQPGWNQIAAPYLFPFAWDMVGGASGLSQPFAFVSGAYVPGVQTLEPWNGYFVENPGSSSVTIQFSVPFSPAAMTPPDNTLSFSDRLVSGFSSGDYGFQITAQSGELADVHTYLVVGDESLRMAKPPAMEGGLYVSETGSGRSLTIASSSSTQWTVTIVGSWQDQRPVNVRLHEIGNFPTGMVAQVIDSSTGTVVAAPNGQFSFHLGGSQQSRTFDIILVEGDQLAAPEPEDRLAAPFPNPVRSGTVPVSLDYWGEDTSTRIDVFDLLGRSVLTLVDGHTSSPGWQRINWNVTDASGTPLAAGTYVIRYRSGGVVTTRPITVVH